MTGLEFRILGPMEVLQDGRLLRLAPRPAALLAALLLQANQVVPADRLIEQVWGDPDSSAARNSLQVLVRRLRRVLQPRADAGSDVGVLVTRAPGYLLAVEPGHLDLQSFEALVEGAKSAEAAGDLEEAARCRRAALALWRGPALAGVPAAGLQRVEIPRLEERRLEVLEARIAMDLHLGRHAELVAELSALVAEHPTDERLHGQLMLALYRSGRQADALALYRKLRHALAEELGLEPSLALQRLQHSILTMDPSLLLPETPSDVRRLAPSGSSPEVAQQRPPDGEYVAPIPPCELPPDIASFTDRESELRRLVDLLDRAAEAQEPVVIAAIDGLAGVGKSALACRLAHRLVGRFPDGQFYVNLHGLSASVDPCDPAEVLGRFLRTFGIGDARIPHQPEERAALFRSLLAGRRVLVVLDNAANAAQVQPLLPTRPGCAALVTSRQRLVELDGADYLHLEVLSPAEAVALLGRFTGVERVTAEPVAAAEVARLCGYLPLALRIAGARLAARPMWPMRTLAERLASEHARLDELQLDGLAVRASLQLTYQALRTGERPAGEVSARVFRLAGLLDGTDVGVSTIAAMLEEPAATAEAALERLVDDRLLESGTLGRYRFHDLVRVFARERAAEEDARAERTAALRRAFRWYVATALRADRLLRPGQATTAGRLREEREETGQVLADRSAAQTWLETERANLVAAVAQAAAGPAPAMAWRLAAALFGFFDVRGYWDDWERVNRLALQAAQGCRDRAAEAQAWRDLGAVAWRRFHLREASTYLRRSLKLRRDLEDTHGQAETLNSIGLVLTARRRYDGAAVCLERSLVLFRQHGDRRGESLVLNNLGDLYRFQRRFQEAIACLQSDLAICRQLGDQRGEAITLCNLGEVYRDQQCSDRAFACHQRSMAICQELGDRRGQGLNLDGLGEALRLQDRHQEAQGFFRQSLTLLRDIGDRYSEADALWHLGLAVDALGGREQACGYWRQALAIYEQINAPEATDVSAALGWSSHEHSDGTAC